MPESSEESIFADALELPPAEREDFDREIVLPDGFTPESIRIEVQSKTRSISSIEESFTWTTSPG